MRSMVGCLPSNGRHPTAERKGGRPERSIVATLSRRKTRAGSGSGPSTGVPPRPSGNLRLRRSWGVNRMRASSKPVALLALLALLLGSSTAGAQQLRGVVRDSASQTPLPGVVLLLLDTSGRVSARSITSEDGGYLISLTPSIQRLRILRIGFRPRELAIPEMVDGSARLDVSMAAIPTLLTGVTVIDQPNCPRRPDRAAAFALWEQTKAALLATVVAREAAPATVLRLHYD